MCFLFLHVDDFIGILWVDMVYVLCPRTIGFLDWVCFAVWFLKHPGIFLLRVLRYNFSVVGGAWPCFFHHSTSAETAVDTVWAENIKTISLNDVSPLSLLRSISSVYLGNFPSFWDILISSPWFKAIANVIWGAFKRVPKSGHQILSAQRFHNPLSPGQPSVFNLPPSYSGWAASHSSVEINPSVLSPSPCC